MAKNNWTQNSLYHDETKKRWSGQKSNNESTNTPSGFSQPDPWEDLCPYDASSSSKDPWS